MAGRASGGLTPLQFLMRRRGIKPGVRSSRKSASPKKSVERPPLSNRQIGEMLFRQKEQRRIELFTERAKKSVKKFRPKKIERGKIVMVGVDGSRNPQAKGRKGYLVYVTKSGKKWWLREKGNAESVKPRTLRNLQVPFTKRLHKAEKEFSRARLKKVGKGTLPRLTGKQSGKVTFGRNAKAVKVLTDGLVKVLRGQKSKRSFLLSAAMTVKPIGGETFVVNVSVPIDRSDHQAIDRGGVANFVRQKFYAALAHELAFAGLVLAGSANHIRKLAINEDVDPDDPESVYLTSNGAEWTGNGLDICTIENMDWKIEQAQ